jgi:hypothetical protein
VIGARERAGTPADRATEAFYVAKADAYGQLPAASSRGSYRLSDDYVTTALTKWLGG